jgi:hypothetical protein
LLLEVHRRRHAHFIRVSGGVAPVQRQSPRNDGPPQIYRKIPTLQSITTVLFGGSIGGLARMMLQDLIVMLLKPENRALRLLLWLVIILVPGGLFLFALLAADAATRRFRDGRATPQDLAEAPLPTLGPTRG